MSEHATIAEILKIMLPLPILGGMAAYFSWRRRHEEKLRDLPFGVPISEAIATLLESGLRIGYTHKEYCGRGLIFWEGTYIHDRVLDGYFDCTCPDQAKSNPSANETFKTRDEFVRWLSVQTSESLCKSDSQGISLARLARAIRFCKAHPTHTWGTYVG